MSNLVKLEFEALDITGKNYLSWVLDAEIHLDAKGLKETIDRSNETSNQDKAKAMIFLRHHLHEWLKTEYLTVKDPADLWRSLKERYDHQKTVILPKARYNWMHLRFQDFKSVSEYNSAIFRISSQLKLCGETVTDSDMMEKTLSTFHASNVLLQQQYREKGFIKYGDLISCLLVAEQNNELLMKNHESRPTGSAPFPEVNGTIFNNNRGRGRGRGRGHGRGRGRGRGQETGRGYFYNGKNKRNNKEESRGNNDDNMNKRVKESNCYRCGMQGHWSRICRTPKHFVDLYQKSLEVKGKKVETNFVDDDAVDDFSEGFNDLTHLDVADFLIQTENDNEAHQK